MDNQSLYLITAIVIVALILNFIATYIVFKTYFIVKERRYYQTIFIWLVPFVGSTLAIYLNRQDYFTQKHEKQIGNNTSITNSQAIDHALGGDHHGGR